MKFEQLDLFDHPSREATSEMLLSHWVDVLNSDRVDLGLTANDERVAYEQLGKFVQPKRKADDGSA